jgi:hypothetical protein
MSTPEASHFSKHYTLAEARALLPEVRQWLDLLDSYQQQLQAIEGGLAALLAKHGDTGGELVNNLARTVADTREILQEFAAREIQIKDIERGLIDFPSWRNGREIFLCWEKDEADIEFWHDLESGYGGRERI